MQPEVALHLWPGQNRLVSFAIAFEGGRKRMSLGPWLSGKTEKLNLFIIFGLCIVS